MNIKMILLCLSATTLATAADFDALMDLRAVSAPVDTSWIDEGLAKSRFDDEHDGLQLGQAVAVIRAQWMDTVVAEVATNAYADRDGVVDVTEAFVNWKPVPTSAWRWRTRIGAFFPQLSFENTGPGWTPEWMLSSSALNNWIGEEFRTIGVETTLHYAGAKVGSVHDWEMSAALFRWNDPAGGLLSWRGWSVGDRVTGLSEQLPFPDLPIFRAGGAWRNQLYGEKAFTEIDGRYGYHAGLQYRYADTLTARAFHYDNRGDPTQVDSDGQWAWLTRFNAVGLRWEPTATWSIMSHYLSGITVMAFPPRHGVDLDYRAWFVLISYAIDAHRFSVRYDDFWIGDNDTTNDDNRENGDALALAWQFQWNEHWSLTTEVLRQHSERNSRELLTPALDKNQQETLWQISVRWRL